MWYLRYFDSWTVQLQQPKWPKWISENVAINTKTTQGYREFILPAREVMKQTKGQISMDCVELDTGTVARHDYKKPLPEWLKDPLIRQMVATTGKVP